MTFATNKETIASYQVLGKLAALYLHVIADILFYSEIFCPTPVKPSCLRSADPAEMSLRAQLQRSGQGWKSTMAMVVGSYRAAANTIRTRVQMKPRKVGPQTNKCYVYHLSLRARHSWRIPHAGHIATVYAQASVPGLSHLPGVHVVLSCFEAEE